MKMKGIIYYIKLLDKRYSELSFADKTRKFLSAPFLFFLRVTFMIAFLKVIDIKSKIKEKRNKLKYFKPTIEEGLLYDTTSWTMRDKPLTDEEVDKLMKG
jgi:hypothetical protein